MTITNNRRRHKIPYTLPPIEFCKTHKACYDGKTFAENYNTMEEVWDNCPNPNWMLWIRNKMNIKSDQKALRLFACYCVRYTPIGNGKTVWDLLTNDRSKNAVIVAEKFANGEATVEELYNACYAAKRQAKIFQANRLREVIPNPFRNNKRILSTMLLTNTCIVIITVTTVTTTSKNKTLGNGARS